MLLHIPRFKMDEKALTSVIGRELEAHGCVQSPMPFFVFKPISPEQARLFDEGETIDFHQISAEQTREAPEAQKADSADDRTFSGVANVLQVSRSFIRIHLDEMDLQNYNQFNPVVLACHEQCSLELYPGAIGTVERAFRSKGDSELRFRKMKFDTDPLAEAWYQKVKNRVVRMVSVGFIPLDWEPATQVIGRGDKKREVMYLEITKSELTEISVVPIGANRGAFIGQHSDELAERVAGIEQRTAGLLDAMQKILQSTDEAKTEQVRSQLLNAIKSYTN